MNYAQVIDLASKVSLAVVLMVILVGGVQGYWVSGSTYKEMVEDRNEWKRLALAGTNLAVRTSLPHVVYGAGPSSGFNGVRPDATKGEVQAKLAEIADARQQP